MLKEKERKKERARLETARSRISSKKLEKCEEFLYGKFLKDENQGVSELFKAGNIV